VYLVCTVSRHVLQERTSPWQVEPPERTKAKNVPTTTGSTNRLAAQWFDYVPAVIFSLCCFGDLLLEAVPVKVDKARE
jgi:hypothetical protein